MTIKELMIRIAGDDLEWADVDPKELGEVGSVEVGMATLAGHAPGGSHVIFRLPVEKLRKKA